MQMICGKCAVCNQVFDIVTAPMPVEAWANTAKARSACPWCGNRAGNLMAPSRPLTEAECAIKTKALQAAERHRGTPAASLGPDRDA
jgi:hypothetical protein